MHHMTRLLLRNCQNCNHNYTTYLYTYSEIGKAEDSVEVALKAYESAADKSLQLGLNATMRDRDASLNPVVLLREVSLLSISMRRYEDAAAAAKRVLELDRSILAAHEEAVRHTLSTFWNSGTNQFVHQQHSLAMKLCSIAMELLDKLPAASKDALKPRMVRYVCLCQCQL